MRAGIWACTECNEPLLKLLDAMSNSFAVGFFLSAPVSLLLFLIRQFFVSS